MDHSKIELLYQLSKEWRTDEVSDLIREISKEVRKEKPSEEKEYDYFKNLRARIDWTAQLSIIPTGLKDIDSRIFWAVKGNIMTICAKTGKGKTTLGMTIAGNMISAGKKVWFISLEMTEEELCDKILSRYAKVRLSSLSLNKFSDREMQNLKENWANAKKIIDSLERTYDCFELDDLWDTISDMAEKWCEAIFVDWLWMIEVSGVESIPKQMRLIMSELKRLAKTHDVAIIAMQQLNRQMDWTFREPFLYDIADGSSIEKISSPVLIMRDWTEEGQTAVKLFKCRRLNDAKFMKWDRLDWETMMNFQLKDRLWYCHFADVDWEDETKPF